MASATKALIRDNVFYYTEDHRARAPFGLYTICRTGDCVSFCSCRDDEEFTMSIDAVIQHLAEGRISLLGGAKLPGANKT